MTKSRLEAFSDGVLAIIITIMVLEIKIPHEPTWQAFSELGSILLSYVLSFVGVAIYWVNHHHLLQVVKRVTGSILWANINLLFWLSLTPFVTGWMGETHFAKVPVIVYAAMCNACGIAYFFLLMAIKKSHIDQPHVLSLISHQARKGLMSTIFYGIALIAAFYYPFISAFIFILVALFWFIPDKKIESSLSE